MAQPVVLQDSFTRMIQDVPRDQLPPDAAWAITDFLPNVGAAYGAGGTGGGRLVKRGGWTYGSENIATDATSALYVLAMGVLTQTTPNRLCLTTDNGKFGYVALPADNAGGDFILVSTSSIGSVQNYVEIGGLLILPNADGTTAPKSYDGTTFQNLAGSPPTFKYAAVWKDRLVGAYTSTFKNRTYFSALDNATSWDTTNSWQDTLHDVTGLCALPNALLIFGADVTARVRGSIPPPGGDLVVDDPIFRVGCTFPMSIATNAGMACFANEEGVFMTNGTNQPQDLTAVCGVKGTWQGYAAVPNRPDGVAPMAAVDKVVGGFIGNYYAITITRLETAAPKTFLFNLVDRSCVMLSNFSVTSACMTPQIGDELYWGIGTRLVSTSPIFNTGDSANKADANGTAVTPSLHTRYYTDTKTWGKRFKTGYLDYIMPDAATDNPTLAVSYTTNPNAIETDSYTSVATLAETTDGNPVTRAKLPVRKSAPGIAFKIVQSNNSKKTVISALLADAHAKEGGRVA